MLSILFFCSILKSFLHMFFKSLQAVTLAEIWNMIQYKDHQAKKVGQVFRRRENFEIDFLKKKRKKEDWNLHLLWDSRFALMSPTLTEILTQSWTREGTDQRTQFKRIVKNQIRRQIKKDKVYKSQGYEKLLESTFVE